MKSRSLSIRVLAVVACLSILATLSPSFVLADTRPITIELDRREIRGDVAPQIIGGRTMVPMRLIFEALGAEITWDQATQTVVGRRGTTSISLTIGNRTATVGGRAVMLDQPAQIINGRTMVPVRFIAESLGAEVWWNEAQRTVKIITPQPIVRVTGLSVASTGVALIVGTEARVEATVEPAHATNPSIIWTSANPGIASVDQQGLIRGLARGATVVTLRTTDGGQMATIIVIVDPLPRLTLTSIGQTTGAGEYTPGSHVAVSTTVPAGQEFVHWTQGNRVVSTTPSFTFAMPTFDTTLAASFRALPRLTLQPPVPQRQKLSTGEVTARVMPAVVRIDTHHNRHLGSGFFVSPDGLVLTNAHVVRGNRQIVVLTHTGERFPATITKIANWHDLALLRVNAPPHIRFPFLSDNPAAGDIRQGEEVLAFGSPLGLTATVTRGIVSAWREMDVTFGAWANNNIRVLQHDAAIAPGNSGGPLVNLYGEWVGVNTLGMPDWAGFGFAVPAEQYHVLLRQRYYSLRCDWDSYRTEHWGWSREIEWVAQLIRELNATPPTQVAARVRLLNEKVSALQNLRQTAVVYQPLSPEVQNLHWLYLIWLDAWIADMTFKRDSLINPALWLQGTANMLRNNESHARNAYVSAWNALSAQFDRK